MQSFAPPPSANTDHIQRKFLDLAYASLSPAQKLDVYLPDAEHSEPRFEMPDNVNKVLDFLDRQFK